MRILIITDQFPPVFFGGMATHAYNIARYLGERHDVLVVTLRHQESSEHKDEPFSVRAVLTKRFPRLDYLILHRIARSFQPDAIHVCTAGLANKSLSRQYPVVTRVVGNDFLKPWCGYNLPFRSILYRLPNNGIKHRIQQFEIGRRKTRVVEYLKQSRCVVANSTWTQKRLMDEGVPQDRIVIIVGGLDTDIFQPAGDKKQIREKLGFPVDSKILITAANLVMKKGIDTVLKAVAECLPKWPDLRYVVVGDGISSEYFKTLGQQLGLEKNVIFIGRKNQNELCMHYQSADVYIQTSRNHKISDIYFDVETMGRTYFEAGACGIPVIAANIGGVSDVVWDNVNGLLVNDPEDYVDVAHKINILLADELLRNRLGAEGLKMAREKFSWNHVGKAFEEQMVAHASQPARDRK